MDEQHAAHAGLPADAFLEILRNSEDYIFVKDADRVYVCGSESFAKMAGLPSADLLPGKTDYDLFPREIAEKYRGDDLRVLERGETVSGIIERLPEKDGRPRWTQTWKHAVCGADGRAAGVYGIGRDVTRTVGLEDAARSAQRYTDLVRNMPGGVGILHEQDGDFILDFANDGWSRAHHMPADAGRGYLGRSVTELVVPEDRPGLLAEYERVREQPDAQGERIYRLIGGDGAVHWIQVSFRFAYEADGVRYYYASYTGMDAQKLAEERLAESRGALREAIANSDIQFFTYFPDRHRSEIYALNDRLADLPMVWDRFPEDFLSYTKASPADCRAYREMLRRVEDGADSAECSVQFAYRGVYTWERLRVKAIRDSAGRLVKMQGYSVNITARKNAEERLQKERVRLKSLEGNVFEAFSFNVTQNAQPNIQTFDKAMLSEPVSEELQQEALRISPPIGRANADTRDILLRAAARIPDPEDRALFISTCGGKAIREAIRAGRSSAEIRYRRRVGDAVCWVSSTAEVLPDPETGDLIAFFYTANINREIIREKIAAHINRLNYETVSYLDLQSGLLYVRGAENGPEEPGVPYAQALEAAAAAAAPAETAGFRSRLAADALAAALKTQPVCTYYFTRGERPGTPADQPRRRMKYDIFYLDEHMDVIVFLRSDVTEIFEQERENREKLAQALVAAEQASVAKTEFLSRMSHEIRTPMNAIIGLDAIALQEKGLSAAMEDHLQKIGISARFLLSLINDILDMSRIESGRMMLKREPFNFESLIDGINTILYEQCRDNGLEYECVLRSYTEETYVGDGTKLQQVLVNILGNAVKFTPRGGKIHFMIEQVSRTKEKARLRFEISDTGIGIDEKFIPHLFEPFSQENRGRTSAYGGSGLGLAISRNIVSLMGGEIAVHSIKNVGTEFTVEVELGLSGDAIRRRSLLDAQLRKLYTLIVDDDVIVCRHTQMILNEAGLKAEWVDSGAGAVEQVKAQHRACADYDLILLDWKMPDMDGIETAREIRRIVGPDVTIIIMTAYDWADIEKRARAAGVDLFMKKPIFASSVTKAFENVFLHRKPEREPEPEPEFDFTGRRVLLCEDNAINAEIAKNLLEMRSCAVELAGNGAEAVESFAAAPAGYYDAVLMDVRMPVMDGLEAARAIRAMRKPDSKTVPILAMTANAFQEDVNLSLESGMNAHLAKPIEPPTLYATLNRYMKKPL